MTIEIECPDCRFLLRADDEFAGESAPCPCCGARITVPRIVPVGITDTIVHLRPTPNERVRRDPLERISSPPHWRLPIPQYGEPRLGEPDEDRPSRYGADWLFGSAETSGPRIRALDESLSSIARIASVLFAPLRRLKPLLELLASTVGCVFVFWGMAYWLSEEYPYLATVIGLFGCLVLYGSMPDLQEIDPERHPTSDEDECEDQSLTPEKASSPR